MRSHRTSSSQGARSGEPAPTGEATEKQLGYPGGSPRAAIPDRTGFSSEKSNIAGRPAMAYRRINLHHW
ncbi:hypothetical protein [Actinoplanes sp. M2I2]|uniref:hypothetical protein n=1 Tax=Actinoplanes sp. M2I2 TaxID=1734444 RepID=UPI002020FB5A|nr:hypothetical protein [Actinoplanes sp. M2I2]